MIGRLKGILASKTPPLLLIDVNGVGYEVFVPMSTYYHLPELGQSVTLLIHFYLREDAQILYGFYDEKERALFRSLIKISGVGPKMALTILSGMDVTTFIQCVEYRDINVLVSLPGVGKKTAERLIVEMAGKLKDTAKGSMSETFAETTLLNRKLNSFTPSPAEDATAALIALGYKPQEATKAVFKIMEEMEANALALDLETSETKAEQNLATPEIIKRALQSFSRV